MRWNFPPVDRFKAHSPVNRIIKPLFDVICLFSPTSEGSRLSLIQCIFFLFAEASSKQTIPPLPKAYSQCLSLCPKICLSIFLHENFSVSDNGQWVLTGINLLLPPNRVYRFIIKILWDTDLSKSDDFLLDPFCIYVIYAVYVPFCIICNDLYKWTSYWLN